MIFYPDNLAGNPTATSNVKDVCVKSFQVSRTDTTPVAGSPKAVIPADATLLGISIIGTVASDAGTTATVSIGTTTGSTEWVNAFDIKTNGAKQNLPNMLVVGNLNGIPLGNDVQVFAKYAETGGASTTGGPWYVQVTYVR